MTVVLDLDTGAIVHTGDGKGADALHGFWHRLKRSGARIEAVAMDMSQAYINAVRAALPSAAIVFDRFHVVKLVNEKLTDLRRQLYRESRDDVERQVLKGSRWLLLKRPAKLDIKRGEWAHLEEVLSLNRPLALGYYLKEELCLFWDQPGAEEAAGVLEAWIERARASGIRILSSLADTVQKHWHGLLAWFDHPISTGPLEGVNNKIRALTRQAYGFRDHEFFRLQLYGLHRTRCELVGASV
jgi:transposase